MRPLIAIPIAAMILVAGWYVSENPSKLGPVFDFLDEYTEDVENSAPIVPLQPDERWLVVVVDFPNAPENGFRNVEKAEIMLTGTKGADDYISQTSGGQSTLTVTILPTVYHAQNDDSYWGVDEGDVRDVGAEGSDGPAGLAQSVIKNSLNSVDLSQFDLNSDGWIDRFLIVHTANVQEDSGGASSIWSHYGPLKEMVEIGDYKFDHYTIAGFDSGFGTIMHEMLHQMGALDLYDVHGHGTGDDWNGLGDWDLMASGNWNGVNGRTPALPSLASMDLIGAIRATEVSISSYTSESQQYILSPLSDGGTGIFIQISPSERVWMSYRGDVGFDKELPGHGLLVTLQDSAVGDAEQNLVNTNPDIPWLYVLEADGDSGLLSGNDEGDSGDVFAEGEKFGAQGRIIYDHHGRKVHWTIEVVDVEPNSITLNLTSPGAPSFTILPPHQPLQLLKNEDLSILVNTTSECTLESNLNSTDGRGISIIENEALTPGITETRTLRWDEQGIIGGEARLEGEFTCGASAPQIVSIKFYNIGLRLSTDSFAHDIPYSSNSWLEIPLDFNGDGQQMWEVRLEGPLDRIATTDPNQELGDGSIVNLTLNPNDLLVPGMVARGELVLRDSQGLEQRSEVILTAEQFEQGGEIVRFFSDTSNIILTMAGLLALSVLLGMRPRKSLTAKVRDRGRAQAMQHLDSEGPARPGKKPVINQVDPQHLQTQNISARPQSIGEGVEQFTGPNRPSSAPQSITKVEVTYDPNHIPDLDDIL
ncbi:MAG TPA: hypothetical protein HA340_01685 [Candidatus Thalassarchaeaceae archaeon]|nr:MAG TPA: hypothetical protein D7H97_01660 [Candidatus Poseidoniales archaeon]HIH82637.1 hypothetical protein [Candidatus Thalassarchaeaceae archaeon]